MSRTTTGGVLVGTAVLFVIIWELRSALGMLLRYDTNVAIYLVSTVVGVGLVAIGLSIGLIENPLGSPTDEDTQ